MTDVLRELQETNRLLRQMASRGAVQELPPSSSLFPADERPSSPGPHAQTSPSPTPLQPELVKKKVQELVQDIVESVFGASNEHRIRRFRDYIMGHMTQYRARLDTNHTNVVVTLTENSPNSTRNVGPSSWFTLLRWCTYTLEVSDPRHLTGQEKEQLQRHLPTQFDLLGLTNDIIKPWRYGWFQRENQQLHIYASVLVYDSRKMVILADMILEEKYGPYDKLEPAAATFGADITSPGTLW
jgi:hypothetical protein